MGPSGLGFLLSTGGAGALTATIILSVLGAVRRRGIITFSAIVFGTLITGFELSHWYPLSLVLLFFAGFSNSFYMISVMTTLQILVPDSLRGRVMGIYAITWNMAPLSAMQAGAVATLIGARAAVALGGIIVISSQSTFFICTHC